MRILFASLLVLAVAASAPGAAATDLVVVDPPGDGWQCREGGGGSGPLVVELQGDCTLRVACEDLAYDICE